MIKPSFEVIVTLPRRSFHIREFKEEAFNSPYHYHPEYELTLITRGTGKRYVGNHMDSFKEGDLVLLAANLPHCWKTDTVHKGEINAASIVVQFAYDFMGPEFFNKEELSGIHNLLEKSGRGIVYKPAVVAEIASALKEMAGAEKSFRQLHIFLEILHKLSGTNEYDLLNDLAGNMRSTDGELERLNTVFNYIIDHFKASVSLNEAAKLASMTPNAFCKFFKKATHKTFMEVVLDYRIDYATMQLIHTKKSVSEICFESGFNDAAHFSRMFRLKMNSSPLQYRKRFIKDL